METINSNAPSAEETSTIKTSNAKKVLKNFFVKSENNQQTTVPAPELQVAELQAAELQRDAEQPAEESREATDEDVKNANAILASAIKISEEGDEHPITEIEVEHRDGTEKVPEDCDVPLPDNECWTAVNEGTSNAWTTLNDESAKAWESVDVSKAYNEMSNHLTKFNESASNVYNQTVNGFATAYVMAVEDLSIMGLAITQTNTMKSLNEFLGAEESDEHEHKQEDECEGEGMEVSLTNRIGDTKNLSEI